MSVKVFTFILTITAILGAPNLWASGGGGGSYGGTTSLPAVQTDPWYERGKLIYSGRSKSYKGIKYCLKTDQSTELLAIKSKVMKPYKKKTYNDLAADLYNCKVPTQQAASFLKEKDILALVYYLNKRYKLKLSTS